MILIKVISPLLLTLFLSGGLHLHPIHVSVTDIEYDEKDKALEIIMRVFIDDLEMTMRKRNHQPELDILNPVGTTLDELMTGYVSDQISIALDKKSQKLNYLGHERDGEAFVFYMEVRNVKKWKEIQVRNTILIETHQDQSNLVHVTVRGKIKSMRLVKSNPVDKLSFDIR